MREEYENFRLDLFTIDELKLNFIIVDQSNLYKPWCWGSIVNDMIPFVLTQYSRYEIKGDVIKIYM